MIRALTALFCCLALIGAGDALAKGKGGRKRSQQQVDCAVLLDPSMIELDVPFSAVVRRVPAYPGQWWSPTIRWTVFVPTLEGHPERTLMAEQVYTGIVSSNRAEAGFVIGDEEGLDVLGEVLVEVTVEEPHQTTECGATAIFAL
jgi:hypothetical protein